MLRACRKSKGAIHDFFAFHTTFCRSDGKRTSRPNTGNRALAINLCLACSERFSQPRALRRHEHEPDEHRQPADSKRRLVVELAFGTGRRISAGIADRRRNELRIARARRQRQEGEGRGAAVSIGDTDDAPIGLYRSTARSWAAASSCSRLFTCAVNASRPVPVRLYRDCGRRSTNVFSSRT